MSDRTSHSVSDTEDQARVQQKEPDYSRDIEFLDFLIDGLKRYEEFQRRLAADLSKQKKRNMLDEFVDLHCGPWGVDVPDPEYGLFRTWHNVGSRLRRAMGTVGRRIASAE